MKTPFWAKAICSVLFELLICWIGVACWNYTAYHWLTFVPPCPTLWLFFVFRRAIRSAHGHLPESYWTDSK